MVTIALVKSTSLDITKVIGASDSNEGNKILFSCKDGSFVGAQFQALSDVGIEENIRKSEFKYSDLSFTSWPVEFNFKMTKDEYFEGANLSYANLKKCTNLNKIQGFVLDKNNKGGICEPFYNKEDYILVSAPKAKNDKYGEDKWKFKTTN